MDKVGNCKECGCIVQTICPLCGSMIEVCSDPERCENINKGLATLIRLNIENK